MDLHPIQPGNFPGLISFLDRRKPKKILAGYLIFMGRHERALSGASAVPFPPVLFP
jgi:hypothetical protein